MRHWLPALLSGACLAHAAWGQAPPPATAQPAASFGPPKTESTTVLVPQHKWLAPPPKLDPAAHFTNLKNGDVVTSPFVVQFGMSFWGIAPAEHAHARTGHHHLLVDSPLPLALNHSIPSNKNYVHFGKGQMQTVLDLPPGKHTLRLLLADHNHVPHMVYSEQIAVTVSERDATKADQLKTAKPSLTFPNLRNGDTVPLHFKVQFHASGLNVSHRGSKMPQTGYFQLRIDNERIPFPGGQTETWLRLPPGSHRLQLEYISNPNGEALEVDSAPVQLLVTGG